MVVIRARIPRLVFTNQGTTSPVRIYDDLGDILWEGSSPRAPLLVSLPRKPRYLVHFLAPARAPRSIHIRLFENIEGVWEAKRHLLSLYEGEYVDHTRLKDLPSQLARDIIDWLSGVAEDNGF